MHNPVRDHLGRIKGIASWEQMGEAVRELRRAAGLTQQQLAERAGVSRLCVSDLERSARQTGIVSLLRVVAALDYEIDLHPRTERTNSLAEYVASFAEGSFTEPSFAEGSFAEGSFAEGSFTEPSFAEGSFTEPSLAEPSLTEESLTEP